MVIKWLDDVIERMEQEENQPVKKYEVTGAEVLRARAEAERITAEEQAQEAYKAYQNNIARTEDLRTIILDMLKAGEPQECIFPFAIEAIWKCTGDDLFRTTAEKYMT